MSHRIHNELDVVVKMIDFAHVYEIHDKDGRDEGYIFGINNLIQYLEEIYQDI